MYMYTVYAALLGCYYTCNTTGNADRMVNEWSLGALYAAFSTRLRVLVRSTSFSALFAEITACQDGAATQRVNAHLPAQYSHLFDGRRCVGGHDRHFFVAFQGLSAWRFLQATQACQRILQTAQTLFALRELPLILWLQTRRYNQSFIDVRSSLR